MKRFFLFVSLLAATVSAGAQVIENDPDFRIGKLANGMTYYLYHNENPAGCADFYIAHNVGALQEEDNQNGLAHFLEHMAFNGTRHYPDKELLNFLAKEGVRFGYNVNAYTSRTETVYNIDKVPLVRESFVDSVLMILHDWSCDILCEQEALDAERGVISEEWRLSDDQRWRMSQKQTGLVYKGGKHPKRTVLGTLDIINGFRREEILDFYDKWYRPDMQAIIVVGDFDVDAMESKVKGMFSDITMPDNPPQKAASYLPPRRDGILIENMTDPAVKFQVVKVMYKQQYPSKAQVKEESYIKDNFYRNIVTSVLSDRLRDRQKEKNSPVQSSVLVTSELKPDYYLSLFTISPKKNNDYLSALDFTLTEVRRLVEFGISEEEFDVAKFNLENRNHINQEVQSVEKTNDKYVKICIENFLRNKPCITPEKYREIQKKVFSELSFDEVKAYPARMFVESEEIISNCMNEKEVDKAPSNEQILATVETVNTKSVTPLYLKYPKMDLKVDAAPGKIISRKALTKEGVEKLTLSNGATVFVRYCDTVKNNIHLSMSCRFSGGYNRLDQEKIAASEFAISYLRRFSGYRNIGRLNFKNYPAIADINSFVSAKENSSSLAFATSAKKMEDAFRCLHLQIMDPYFSTERDLKKFSAEKLKNLGQPLTSRTKFDIDNEVAEFGPHPWLVEVDSAAVNAVDMAFVKDVFTRLYGDVKSMTLYVCTDASREQIEDYICKYVASINRDYPYALAKIKPIRPTFKGIKEFTRTEKPVNAPLCKISYNFSTTIKKNTFNRVTVEIFDYLMSARYLDLIREKRGGAYHAGLATTVGGNPKTPIIASVDFQTRPQLREILLNDVKEEMGRMSENGPSGQEMDVAKKYFSKAHAERRKLVDNSTGHMLDELEDLVENGKDYGYDYNEVLSSIKASDIQKLAGKLLNGNIYVSVYSEE